MQKDYDVLRLIEHNRICYVSSDNVRGCPLAKWMKYHPYLPKEKVVHWIHEIVRQLIQIHKCRGNPCYQYVNPYSIIVSEDGHLNFLDISADSNKERVRMMQKRNIREYFRPKEEGQYQSTNEEVDVYGLGKTVQYLLAFIEVNPGFTRREEKRLQKMISKCIYLNDKKSFHKVAEVQRYLPELILK